MKLDELYEAIEKDLPIDKFNLADESVRIGNLFIKYQILHSKENLLLKKLELCKTKIIQEKRDYYSGNAPAEIYLKKPFGLKLKTDAAIQKYVEADEDVLEVESKIIGQKEKVNLLFEVTQHIRWNRDRTIRNAIDMLKYEAGF